MFQKCEKIIGICCSSKVSVSYLSKYAWPCTEFRDDILISENQLSVEYQVDIMRRPSIPYPHSHFASIVKPF